MQLQAMSENPDKAIGSHEAELTDIRPFRQGNPFSLPDDTNGLPTWENLLLDLRELMGKVRPEIIVLPHPDFDPQPDHIAASAAVRESLQGMDWRPQTLLTGRRWPRYGDNEYFRKAVRRHELFWVEHL